MEESVAPGWPSLLTPFLLVNKLAGYHHTPLVMQLEGQFDKVLSKCTEVKALQLLAIHLKSGERGGMTALNPEILSLLRSSRAAVMFYREKVARVASTSIETC